MKITDESQRAQVVGKIERIRTELLDLVAALDGEDCVSDILESTKWLALAERKMAEGTSLKFFNSRWWKR